MKLLSRLTATLAIILFMATTASAQGTTPDLTIDNSTFAGISIGMKMNKVPKSIPGIYDEYIADQADCSGAFSFYCVKTNKFDGTNPEIIVSDDAMDKLVDKIDIFVKGARIANTNIEIGTPISKAKNTPGLVKEEWGNFYYYTDHYLVILDDSEQMIESITIRTPYKPSGE